MRSRARLQGRLMLQLLRAFSVALLGIAVVFDLIDLATGTGAFAVAACWTLTAGLVSALLLAPLGLIDWHRAPPGSSDRRDGALHGIGNLLVLALFAASWLLRDVEGLVPRGAVGLSVAAVILALVNAWLCGEVWLRRGARLYEAADPDPPHSSGFHDTEEGPSSVVRPARRARAS